MFRRSLCTTCYRAQQSAGSKPKIDIPLRKKRGPTDLLQALGSTVSRDPTAAAFRYLDDPFLIPPNDNLRRQFTLAKEQGKKLARQIALDWPTFFLYELDEPRLSSFRMHAAPVNEERSDVESLKDCMENRWIKNAITIYSNMQEQNVQIPDEIKQELLELVSFYNCEEPPLAESDYQGERWYHKDLTNDINLTLGPVWKTDGEADMLFEEMSKTSLSYSAMITGHAKYRSYSQAMKLLKEMRSSGHIPTVEAYNSVIDWSPMLQRAPEDYWSLVMDILQWMADDKVQPNLGTFNCVLNTLVTQRNWPLASTKAQEVFREMTKLGIKPSLKTYGNLVQIMHRSPLLLSLIEQVLDEIEDKDWTAQDVGDGEFFTNAMRACHEVLKSKDLAYRIHKLYCKGTHSLLFTHNQMELNYYRSFLSLLVVSEELDQFFKVYNTIVPHLFSPNYEMYYSILDSIESTGNYHYLASLWQDLQAMNSLKVHPRFKNSFELLKTFVDHMLEIQLTDEDSSSNLKKDIHAMISDLRARIDEEIDRSVQRNEREEGSVQIFTWHADLLIKSCVLLARADDYEQAMELFRTFLVGKDEKELVKGVPPNNLITEMLNHTITAHEFWNSVDVLEVADRYSIEEVPQMVDIVLKHYKSELSNSRRTILNDFAEAHRYSD